ncbi:MAG: nitrous oxide reductase accessory protein NosL [Chitinophagaceae bacterium]|nr:nitrous oxide reductase accessory protein NosL [Chitinophagaceae bacterium]
MSTQKDQLSISSRILLIISGVMLTISIFVPIWRIELAAPQYPEGLCLLIHSNKLAGNVDIINGLNHYIGMKTLHAEEFIEFTVLPYIIGFFALLSFIVAVLRNKKILYILFALFILFGVIAMIDFWRWEYNYGHNLDPTAAIIVPGMAYQPPLIGYKQLLNFGAYSVPDIGGWLFIVSGIFMFLTVLIERHLIFKSGKNLSMMMFFLILCFFSCNTSGSEPIQLNRDHCDYCKMSIANGHFAAEFKTEKGRAYKFDDISCMSGYLKEQSNQIKVKAYYISDYTAENTLIAAESAYYITSEAIGSPMGGNIAAFHSKEAAKPFIEKYHATEVQWQEILH